MLNTVRSALLILLFHGLLIAVDGRSLVDMCNNNNNKGHTCYLWMSGGEVGGVSHLLACYLNRQGVSDITSINTVIHLE